MALTTVIVPAHNVAPYIDEAIESVLAQTISDWKLVLIDDGSQDSTAEIIEGYCAKDSRISLIRQENAGPAAARNAGVATTDTEFISFLDADDAYEPEYLEAMTNELIEAPDLAFTCCDAYFFTAERIPGIKCSQTSKMTGPITIETVATRNFQVYGSITIRRSWFEKVGGYDVGMKAVEDFEMNIRILAAGGKATHISRPLAWYRRRPGSVSGDTTTLTKNTLKIYDRLKTTHPAVELQTREHQKRLKLLDYLHQSKLALQSRNYDQFTEMSKKALAIRRNWKLRAMLLVSRVSPPVARWIATLFR